MKKALFLLLLAATVAQAQPRQPRSLPDFTAVQAQGGVRVVLSQGPSAVFVEAEAAVQPQLLSEVQDGVLLLRWNSRKGSISRKATVYVSCPRLTALTADAGSQVRSAAPIEADDLSLTASSGSQIKLEVNAKSLNTSVAAGSTLTLAGQATRQSLAIHGGASYHAFALQCRSADVAANGGSTAELSVSQDLTAAASGGSSVRYKGSPHLSKSEASGGGSVRMVE